jgi:hypothetical protein
MYVGIIFLLHGAIAFLSILIFFHSFSSQRSQESPQTPEVLITSATSFQQDFTSTVLDADKLYNDTHNTCYQKCAQISFNLGSSSIGKRPRRPRRIIQPNSYYHDFSGNTCSHQIILHLEDRLAHDVVKFLGSDVQYSW